MTVLAWHFVGNTLRDGRPVPPDGVTLRHKGPLKLCASGLHASLTPWEALNYAPGETLCLVRCDGEILYDTDKLVCSKRTIIRRMDATELLRYFGRMQAVSVLHLWQQCPPDVVLDYLMTGDDSLQAAAWDAARAAAWAASDAARAAAWAASDAASDAAWDAARAAALVAAASEFNALVYECFEVTQ